MRESLEDIIGISDRGMPAPEAGRRSPFMMSAVGALMHPRHRPLLRVAWHPNLKRQSSGWRIIQAPLPEGRDNCWLGVASTRQEAVDAGTQVYGGREFYVVPGERVEEGGDGQTRWVIEDGKARLGAEQPARFCMTQEPELVRL